MDPMRLLNPKGYAKAQEKSKKKAPNYGPTQSRKPAAAAGSDAKPSPVRFDPRALLNPKAAVGRLKMAVDGDQAEQQALGSDIRDDSNPIDAEDQGPGLSSMLEKQYGVTERESALVSRKRNTPADGEDEDEQQRKKSKAKFDVSTDGIISDHMKAEREKTAAESGPAKTTIDLTNDDDDLVVVSENRVADSREVCLGKISVKAGAFRIPRGSRNSKSGVPNDFWPMMRVFFRRPNVQTQIVDLIDRPQESATAIAFARLDHAAASAILPLIDGSHVNKLRLKMFVDPIRKQNGEYEGCKISRPINISIILFAPRDKATRIGVMLSQKQLFLSVPPAGMVGRIEYWNPQVPEEYASSNKVARKPQRSSGPSYGVARTEEQMRREAEGILDELFNLADEIPEMEADGTKITTPLMTHQKQALHFLTTRERADGESAGVSTGVSGGDSAASLWKSRQGNRGEVWYNVITNHELREKPPPVRGGILADMMGLGKTLSILALLTSTMDEAARFGGETPSADLEDIVRNSKATLIICPKSVLSNWQEQVKQHTKKRLLQIYCYHGPARTQDFDELANYDIVLTSYSTASSEFSDPAKRRNALGSIQWFRIVLDEAHQIRTQNTQFFQSCRALAAQRRWALTGTPLQNSVSDIGSLVRFLRLKPFDDGTSFAQHISGPIKRGGNKDAVGHLQMIIHGITLRRTKERIDLPERREDIVRLDFTEAEAIDVHLFSRTANRDIRIMSKSRFRGKSYAHMLKSIGRLRAYCAHGREMLHEDDMKELEGLTASTAIDLGDEPDEENKEDGTFIAERHAYETLHMMTESETDTCTKCGRKVCDAKDDPEANPASNEESSDEDDSSDEGDARDVLGYLTPCYHLICPSCKDDHVALTLPKLRVDHYHHCPHCEQYVRFGLFELRRSALKAMLDSRRKLSKRKGKAQWDESNYSGPSTKVKALLDDLRKNEAETASLGIDEPPIRSVIFSGWTTYLDLIEVALDDANIGYARLDGSMGLKARASVIETFKADPAVTVLLVSIKAGGQGLNFTAASRVYMMEPQFNPGVEQQAIDRVHRMGQKRPVEIKRYIMRTSVEEGILRLQEKKNNLAKVSLDKKKVGTSGGDMVDILQSIGQDDGKLGLRG
ncbi:uncharacterized protein LTR77_000643 [Saxophila tyrrhenica]|uniref:Uncharacterized protein n=1 Tax=Saxophila tyrrhenica TaxID=1690608 RepID=A0AAV9PN86_9PEZI|nr:hypothetical protein LTR77_000643 [Saxophila tyrrhenica]